MGFFNSLKDILLGSTNDKIRDNGYGYKRTEYDKSGNPYLSSRLYYNYVNVSFNIQQRDFLRSSIDGQFLAHAVYEGNESAERGDYVVVRHNGQVELGYVVSLESGTREELPKPLFDMEPVVCFSRLNRDRNTKRVHEVIFLDDETQSIVTEYEYYEKQIMMVENRNIWE